jgi:8-oxo-dGTP pyrophosphatase MutT (NUDIX family)
MEYVLIDVKFAGNYWEFGDDKVLLMEKTKPAWQAGRFNLVGGKIEEGESIEEASIRELKEETGLDGEGFKLYGKILFNGGCVHCVGFTVFNDIVEESEEGKAIWLDLNDAFVDSRLIPNLKVIIPLIRSGVVGWELIDNLDSLVSGDYHTVTLSVLR